MRRMNRNGRRLVLRPAFRAESLERRALLSGDYLIQDATINEGDSGSPLMSFRVDWVGSFQSESGAIRVTTSDGTASAAEGDYVHQQTFLTFPANQGEPRRAF